MTNVGVFFTKNGRLRLLNVSDEENKRKYLHSEEISEAIDTMYEVRRKINNNEFPPRKQFLCKFCTYQEQCDDEFFNFR